MAKPCDVTTDKIGRKLVLIVALHRDDMTEDALGHGTAHDETLHDVAFLACKLECSFTGCSLREFNNVLAGLDAADGHEPVVNPYNGHVVVAAAVSASLLAEATAHAALAAPGAEGDVGDAVLFDFSGAGHFWRGRYDDRLGLFRRDLNLLQGLMLVLRR